jgi:hypothetical protein
MRRLSLAIALIGAAAAAGCGGGTAPTATGTGRGVPGSTFTVQVRGDGPAFWDPGVAATSFRVVGGRVRSTPAGIDCGTVNGVAVAGACTADFAWGTAVTLAAYPDPDPDASTATANPNTAWAFAGSCGGAGACALDGNADKMVLVRFAATQVFGHPNFSAGAVHGPEYLRYVAGTSAYDCRSCHGASLQGEGLALGCGTCHSAKVTAFLQANTSPAVHAAGNAAFGALFDAAPVPTTGPGVTTLCIDCHRTQVTGFMASQHWSWKGPTPQLHALSSFQLVEALQDPGTVGKVNLINNFCVSVASNEKRCDQCHAGYGGPGITASGKAAHDPTNLGKPELVDCLICHSARVSGNNLTAPVAGTAVTYQKSTGSPGWGNPSPGAGIAALLKESAVNLRAPTRDNCGFCHFGAGGDDSVKIMSTSLIAPSSAVDVHMSPSTGNLTCADCHADASHRVRGAGVHTPTAYARLSCTECHATPHAASAQAATIDSHLDTVACQTCHIPAFARGQPIKVDWDWSTAGYKGLGTGAAGSPVGTVYVCLDPATNVESATTPAYTGTCAAGLVKLKKYDYMKGTFTWGQSVRPTYAWYNGTMTHVTTADRGAFTAETGTTTAFADRITLSAPAGSRADATAKIFPFKVMTGRQAVYVDDANGGSFVVAPGLFSGSPGDGSFWGTTGTAGFTYVPAAGETAGVLPAAPLGGTYNVTYAGVVYASEPWDNLLGKVFAKGAKAAGQVGSTTASLPRYAQGSAGWDWRYTKMYMDLEHEVAPAAQALSCDACHGPTPVIDFTQLGYGCANPASCPR